MINLLKSIFRNTAVYQKLHKYHRANVDKTERANYPQRRKDIIHNYLIDTQYLNVGDGYFAREDWRLLDYAGEDSNYPYDQELLDYNINLLETKEWPIPNNSFNAVYSSHCLEHLTMDAIRFSIGQIFRVLKPGGIFRLTVPDIDPAYEAYLRFDLTWFEENGNSADRSNITAHFLDYFSNKKISDIDIDRFNSDIKTLSKTDFLNKYINSSIDLRTHRFESHVSWINFDLAQSIGKDIGFSKVLLSSKGKSLSKEMQKPNFDHKPGKGNLYVDFVKQ